MGRVIFKERWVLFEDGKWIIYLWKKWYNNSLRDGSVGEYDDRGNMENYKEKLFWKYLIRSILILEIKIW